MGWNTLPILCVSPVRMRGFPGNEKGRHRSTGAGPARVRDQPPAVDDVVSGSVVVLPPNIDDVVVEPLPGVSSFDEHARRPRTPASARTDANRRDLCCLMVRRSFLFLRNAPVWSRCLSSVPGSPS